MSHIQQNSHSMNGINSLEINEIIFDDGTSITSNDFASSTDLTALASLVQTNTNKVGITSSQATAIANIQTISAGEGLTFDGDILDADVTSFLSNAKASDYDVVAPLVKTQHEIVSFGENPVELSVNHDSTVTENSTNLITSGAVYTSVHAKPLPQLRMISFDKDKPINAATQSTTTWGLGARHKTIKTDRVVGESFLSIINYATFNGSMTITANGYYRIRAAVNLQQDSYSDRLAFMIYLRINTTDYDEDEDYNFLPGHIAVILVMALTQIWYLKIIST